MDDPDSDQDVGVNEAYSIFHNSYFYEKGECTLNSFHASRSHVCEFAPGKTPTAAVAPDETPTAAVESNETPTGAVAPADTTPTAVASDVVNAAEVVETGVVAALADPPSSTPTTVTNEKNRENVVILDEQFNEAHEVFEDFISTNKRKNGAVLVGVDVDGDDVKRKKKTTAAAVVDKPNRVPERRIMTRNRVAITQQRNNVPAAATVHNKVKKRKIGRIPLRVSTEFDDNVPLGSDEARDLWKAARRRDLDEGLECKRIRNYQYFFYL
jgi:hypothetical protein